MPKNKPNKGLLKRIRITKSGKIKFRRAFGRHLRSHKSGDTMRGYRRPTYATPGDTRRVCAMLFTNVTSSAHVKKGDKADAAES
ncbi:MAG: 50S ribosomal protein L35 [Phycisphaerales bacterium]|nr:50S ribosomal protein L35 [Phycisphaerales bacterium]